MDSNFNGMLYFSNEKCSVCLSLWPKLFKMAEKKFPSLKLEKVDLPFDAVNYPNLQVFNVPTLLVFLQGQEFIRLTGVFSLNELEAKLNRLVQLLEV